MRWDGVYSKSDENKNLTPLYPQDGVFWGDNLLRRLKVYDRPPGELPELTVLSLLSGRWQFLGHWLRNLEALRWPKEKISILMFSTSADPYFNDTLAALVGKLSERSYKSIALKKAEGNLNGPLVHSEKASGTVLHLDNISRAYEQAFALVETKFCFSVEDDQVVPAHAALELFNFFEDKSVACASGIARGRHGEGFVAFDFFINNDTSEIVGVSIDKRKLLNASCVGSSGLGCTLLDMEAVRQVKLVYKLDELPNLLGVDVLLGYQLNRIGRRVICDSGIYSYHLSSQGVIY